MPDIIKSFMALSNAKKVTYLVLLSAAIGAMVVLFQWAAQPEFEILYSNLSPEDAASIIEELKGRRIPYKIEGGSTIMVPGEDLYETRLELAGAGLPRGGGIGFEIFDKSGFGISEFTQKINYMRALQGELARTISWLSEVETARVHIVVPEKRLFREDEEESTASVIIKLRPGRRLAFNQVQGIVHLVASSVKGLSPQNVTVVDTDGKMLTRAEGGDDSVAITPSQLEYQRSIEKDLEKRVKNILEPVVGSGKVITSVTAEIDFKRVEKTEEKFDPDNVVVRSEQRTKEKLKGGQIATGIPGVASNIPDRQGAGALNNQNTLPESQRQNETINYEINKVVSRTIEPSGVIKRLSVAVLVDGSYRMVSGDKQERQYIPRREEEIKNFEALIKSAVGFVAERGDKIEVINIPFEMQKDIQVEEIPESSMLKEYLPSIIRYGVIMILSILLFLFVLRPLIKGLFSEKAQQQLSGDALQESLKAIEKGLEQKSLSSSTEVKKKILELASQNPQQAAQIVKAWVKET